MIQSQIVLHRFEAVMRRVGWGSRRPGPLRDRFHRLAISSPHLERYADYLASPNGTSGLTAGSTGVMVQSSPAADASTMTRTGEPAINSAGRGC
jgi:hypothetical protein